MHLALFWGGYPTTITPSRVAKQATGAASWWSVHSVLPPEPGQVTWGGKSEQEGNPTRLFSCSTLLVYLSPPKEVPVVPPKQNICIYIYIHMK